VRAVHQFVPILEGGAVGAHTLQVQRLARDLGMESTIFAAELAPGFEVLGELVDEYRVRGRRDDVLLYQAATGSAVADLLLEHPQRLLVNYHNLTPARFFEGWAPDAVHSVTWGWSQVRKLAKESDLGIAVSAFNERELRTAGFRETAVAPVLVDVEAFDRAVDHDALARLTEAKVGGGADLLFVGRLAPNKAQHDLIKALAAYRRLYDPKARLHVVGTSSSESYRTALVAYADALGLADAVELTGSVSDGELAAHYRAADVFVCVSEHEGFCVPLLEAMHHRLPIVAYAAAAVPETLADAGVLLPTKDPLTVAAAVHRVLADETVAAALRERGGVRLGDFSLERSRRRFTEVLEAYLSGG
jgi:glycosyltransferase involved in cell wall biosynthesis